MSPMEQVNGIIEDVSGVKLLSTTVSIYPADCVLFLSLFRNTALLPVS